MKSNPALITNRGKLLVLSRQAVADSGYQFKKGRSRSKFHSSGDEVQNPKPKRLKADFEVRMTRMKELQEIQQFKEHIKFKEKRLQQAEGSKNYKLCDLLSEEIQEIRREKRQLENELASWMKKEKRSKAYFSKKTQMLVKNVEERSESDSSVMVRRVSVSAEESDTSRSSVVLISDEDMLSGGYTSDTSSFEKPEVGVLGADQYTGHQYTFSPSSSETTIQTLDRSRSFAQPLSPPFSHQASHSSRSRARLPSRRKIRSHSPSLSPPPCRRGPHHRGTRSASLLSYMSPEYGSLSSALPPSPAHRQQRPHSQAPLPDPYRFDTRPVGLYQPGYSTPQNLATAADEQDAPSSHVPMSPGQAHHFW